MHVLEDGFVPASAACALVSDAPGNATWLRSSNADVCFLEAAEKRACLVAGEDGRRGPRLFAVIRLRRFRLDFGAGAIVSACQLLPMFRHYNRFHLADLGNECGHTMTRSTRA